jgi:hypothetical protein
MRLTEDIMRIKPHYLATAFLGVAAILTLGCGDSTAAVSAPPPTGAIEITVSTAGAITDIDPDGYFLSIDEGPKQSVRVDATVRIDGVRLGTHLVRLDGLAANCAVDGANLRSVDVIADAATSTVSFAVSCLPNDSGAGEWDY